MRRQNPDGFDRFTGLLGVGIKIAQCVDFGIEQFHSQGILFVQGIDVDDAPAYAELARAGNHPFTGIAHCDQFFR